MIKVLLLLCLALGVAVTGLQAQTPTAADQARAAQAADAEWSDLDRSFPRVPVTRPTADARVQLVRDLFRASGEFRRRYPDDERGFAVLVRLNYYYTVLVGAPPTEAERTALAAALDEKGRAELRGEVLQLTVAARESADLPAGLRLSFDAQIFTRKKEAALVVLRDGQPADLDWFRAAVARMGADFPDEYVVGTFATEYADLLQAAGKGLSEIKRELEAFATSPNQGIRDEAAARINKLVATSQLVEIAFTAVDGRPVDLAKLRGKVVLVDFWATWCGPCIKEIPNLKRVYAAYHDRGFEVVGIALENAGLTPKDTAEQKTAKLDAARRKLLAFVAEQQMPWPQHFDGLWWKTPLVERFGIRAAPGMLLVDREGRIASIDAHGDKLEPEVKRLLGL